MTETIGTAREKISEGVTIGILTRPETTSIQEDTETIEPRTPKGSKQTDLYRRGKGYRIETHHEKVINMVNVHSSKKKKRKDREATESWMNTPISFPPIMTDDASDEPLIIEAEVEGYLVQAVLSGTNGSSVEVMFEHCFENLPEKVKAGLRETRTDLVGFAGEVSKPLGKIDLEVCFGNEGLSRRTSMKFIVIRAPSPYNVILGRPGLKILHAIPSNIHSMIKFPTPKGIATLIARTITIAECRKREERQMIREEAPQEEGGMDVTEQIIVNPSFPDQMVTIGGRLSKGCVQVLLRSPTKGNNKSKLAKEDEEKTAFYTEQGTYGYTKMPFGLKNAGATYQRLVDSTFQSQIGRNLEAYVDDMVIKVGRNVSPWLIIAETVHGHSRGSPSKSKKTKAISDLQSPKNIARMRKAFSGKLASLNRFLAKSAERALPFFNTLKNITKENKHEFRWTTEAEEAFQQMKRLIMSLPSLTPPFPEETLYAYLAVSKEAVSAVLLTDRNGRQCPVQYVSRTLNEAERNYSPLEKLALSLVNMTRRLRRYFEAHPVKVITDQPIRNILSRTEASGKLAKYAVEIGTYKISFIPRNAVKGQVLADFLSDAPDGEREDEYFQSPEVPPEIDDTETWTLYTDGAANAKGSGAGLILTGPSGVEYAYALR
ncbi:reverse transcriptase domain-containing protein [Tanacetum coccineum]